MSFEFYIKTSKSLAKLFHPFVEIVVHDVRSQKIVSIIGSLSNRRKGDDSLLDQDLLQDVATIDQVVYTKVNFDGRLIKSISVSIKDQDEIIGLWCFNFDITIFQEFGDIAQLVVHNHVKKKPAVLFQNDWQDKIHQFVYDYLKKHDLQFTSLNNKQKKEIVHNLYEHNAFSEKNAADYIAKTLDMSRSTIFNYLREWKKDEN